MPDDLITIYQRLGRDIPKHNGDNSRHADINADYMTWSEPENTLDALKMIL